MKKLEQLVKVTPSDELWNSNFFQQGRQSVIDHRNKLAEERKAALKSGKKVERNERGGISSERGYWVKKLITPGDYDGWYKYNKTYFLLKNEMSGKIKTGVWIAFMTPYEKGVNGDCILLDNEEKNLMREYYKRNGIGPLPILPKNFKSNCENGYLFKD
jgi:hypothetical protein